MEQYREQLQLLNNKGMYFRGAKKSFVGKVDGECYFNRPGLIVNTFGYYQYDDKTWIAFVTDEERGIETITRECASENDVIEFLIQLAESRNFSHYYHTIMDDFHEHGKVITHHLQEKYGYSAKESTAILNELMQAKPIAFECWHLIQHGKYVPDKFATHYAGYTAKLLQQKFQLSDLGAFRYMVHLKNAPDETLTKLRENVVDAQERRYV